VEQEEAPVSDEEAEPVDKNKDLDQIDRDGVSEYDDVVYGRDENTV